MPRAFLRPLRWRRAVARRSVPAAVGRPPGNFLTDTFPTALQWIEAAFGADLTADPDTWSWTDITAYVQWNPGVDITIGYPDEAINLVSAKFTAVLRNDQANGGEFTLGNALSPRWPNVRENTPIRARLDLGNGPSTRFYGYATSWKPKRGPGGAKFVTLQANGISRRVRQGQGAAKSAAQRMYDAFVRNDSRRADLVGYWTLEDGTSATSAASGLRGGTPMGLSGGSAANSGAVFGTAQGRTQLAYTGFEITRIGVKSFVSLNQGGKLTADLPTGTATKFSVQFTAFAWHTANVVLARWFTPGGPFEHYDVRFRVADGATELLGYNAAGVGTSLIETDIGLVDEFEYVFSIAQNGANVETSLDIYRFAPSVGFIGSSALDSRAGTVVLPTRIVLNPDGTTITPSAIAGSDNQETGMRFSNLAVWYSYPHAYLTNTVVDSITGIESGPWNGWVGESATNRADRLCTEQGVPLDIIGTSDTPMGFQDVGAFTDLLSQCTAVDQGILLDGLGPGFTYVARTSAYSRAPRLTLSASAGDFPGELEGEHDDRFRVNDYTATDPVGSAQRFTQTDGDLGTDTVGTYDDSADYRTRNTADLLQIAAWRVAQGTVPGLRWPKLAFQLAKPITSTKAQAWLERLPLDRIDATGITTGSDPDRALLLRGWSEKWNSKSWSVEANVTPYDAFAVTKLATDTGDTDPFLGWLDTDGSTTQAGIAAGATSVVVVTPSGPPWTNATTPSPTYADDIVGLYIDLDGMKVGVTAITGSSSPQTFTINGADVLRAVPPGAPVSVWPDIVARVGM